jgi:hypothetical protein
VVERDGAARGALLLRGRVAAGLLQRPGGRRPPGGPGGGGGGGGRGGGPPPPPPPPPGSFRCVSGARCMTEMVPVATGWSGMTLARSWTSAGGAPCSSSWLCGYHASCRQWSVLCLHWEAWVSFCELTRRKTAAACRLQGRCMGAVWVQPTAAGAMVPQQQACAVWLWGRKRFPLT